MKLQSKTIFLAFTAFAIILTGCGNPVSQILEKAQENYNQKLAAAPECKISESEFKGTVEDLKTRLEGVQKNWAMLEAYTASGNVTQKEFEANSSKHYGNFCGQDFYGYSFTEAGKASLKTETEYATAAKDIVAEARTFFKENPEVCKRGQDLESNFWFMSNADQLLPMLTKVEKHFATNPSKTACSDLF